MSENIFVNIVWGYYDEDGNWHHNPNIDMTPEEQYLANKTNHEDFKPKIYLNKTLVRIYSE